MFRRILFTAIAVVLALTATAGVALYAKSADARALKGQETVVAYVAVKTVPAGTSAGAALSSGLIRAERLARRTVPAGALTSVGADVSQLVASTQIPAGTLVLKAVFTTPEKVSSTGLVVPKGKLAVTVELEDPARVAGLVQPGSNVAVFDTFTVYTGAGRQGNNPNGESLGSDPTDVHTTRVLIPAATVLAIGQVTRPVSAQSSESKQGSLSAGKTGGSPTKLVTLAVTQAEAERLITVAQTGKPWFALLGDDSKVSNGPGVDTRHLFTYGDAR